MLSGPNLRGKGPTSVSTVGNKIMSFKSTFHVDLLHITIKSSEIEYGWRDHVLFLLLPLPKIITNLYNKKPALIFLN